MTRPRLRFAPTCCCCNDIYSRSSPVELVRVTGGKAERIARSAPVAASVPDFIDVDYDNERVYWEAINSSAVNSILSAKRTDFSDQQTLLTHDAGSTYYIRRGLAVHGANGHLFYGAMLRPAATSLDREVRRIDLGGTNDQTIVAFASDIATQGSVYNMEVSREEEYVFYQLLYDNHFSARPSELRRCDADGGNDLQLWTVPDAAAPDYGDWAIGMSADNEGKLLYWATRPGVAGNTYKIWRSTFDGASATMIYEAEPATGSNLQIIRLAGWSHVKRRLYFWLATAASPAPTDRSGLYSSLADGSDLEAEVSPPSKWEDPDTGVPSDAVVCMKLGCGYEKFGANAQA